MGHKIHGTSRNRLIIEEAHVDEAYHLGSSLRPVDYEEMRAATGITDMDPGELLALTMEGCGENLSISTEKDGEKTLRALWGYCEWSTEKIYPNACIWLVSDETLFKEYSVEMTRRFRKDILPALLEVYGSVGNYVMASNAVHMKWLERAGFESWHRRTINGNIFNLMAKEL